MLVRGDQMAMVPPAAMRLISEALSPTEWMKAAFLRVTFTAPLAWPLRQTNSLRAARLPPSETWGM